MPKRLSENQKKEIIKNFLEGATIDQLSLEFSCSKATITRNLKKELGDQKYKDYINKIKKDNEFNLKNKKIIFEVNKNSEIKETDYELSKDNKRNYKDSFEEVEVFSPDSFMEIAPLNLEIENCPQKDLSLSRYRKYPKLFIWL